jgi:hypothetical protein
MINNQILDLYDARRRLLIALIGELNAVGDCVASHDTADVETHELINEMSELISSINDLCGGDYILIDMYRRLSLALSKEQYEEASLVGDEIINHKS